MSGPAPISVLIPVRNEAGNLPACLASVAPDAWSSIAVGVFASSLVTGLFGLGLPLLVPRWAALAATTMIAVFVSTAGAGLDEWMRDEPTSVLVSWCVGPFALLVVGALRTSRRLARGST